MQQARHRLCCEIIKQHFGQTAKRIFETLLNERQTLDELLKHHQQEKVMINDNDHQRLVQKSLKTLIQHHVVRHYLDEKDNAKASPVYYEADVDCVEMRLHFPRFINIVKVYESNFDIEYAHLLIQYLCEHGQCTKQQLFDLWAHTIYGILDDIQNNDSNHTNSSPVYTDNNQKYSFSLQFDMNKFGEWTRCMSIKSKGDKKKEIRHHFKRIFKWLINDKCFIIKNNNRNPSFSAAKSPSKKLRKLDGNEKVSMDEETDPKYVICYRSLLHDMRCEAIRDFVLQKYDSSFCDIVDVILENSLSVLRDDYRCTMAVEWLSFNKKDQMRSEVFKHSVLEANKSTSIDNRYSIGKQIHNDDTEHYKMPFDVAMGDIEKQLKMSREAVEESVKILSDGNEILDELNDILPVLIARSSGFHVNVCGIIDYIRKLDVQRLVHSRFDTLEVESSEQRNEASRLFGAIISMRKIGDKQLSEICMMKHATVKKVLYRMLSDKFVEMEYIARSIDRDPKKSLFLWSINWCSLHKKILQSLYNATANLMVKQLNIRKIIQKIENDNSHKTNKNTKQKWTKLCAAFEHLTRAIQKIDTQIALHRDF
eukprot:225918_1